MNDTPTMPRLMNDGKKVKRIREILGIKQETLAADLGINQQKMSFIEQKESIEDEQMAEIAKALNVPIESIKNFTEETAITIISSTLHDYAGSVNYNPTFNPIDKVVELYERMIKEKDEQIEKLLKGKKKD